MDKSFLRSGRAFLLTIFFATLSWLWLSGSAVAGSRFTILYHEGVVLRNVADTDPEPVTHGTPEILRFDAFGRHFEVQLEKPARLQNRRRNHDIELFTGRLTATPKSWVRLMRQGERLSGIIRHDSETFFIEPRSNVLAALANIDVGTDSINIIYRLADTLVEPGLLSCETQQSNGLVDGQTAFTKLAAELAAVNTKTAAAHVPNARIGVIGDLDFFARFGNNSASEIESLFNVVDGIFTEQVGVEINVAESLIISSESQNPFSATTIGVDLLDELGNWRRMNQADLALTHLVTDRDLSGADSGEPIAGLSFFGVPGRAGVCFAQSGAGMSAWFGNLTALIITHEIAHNFGAPHDGEPSDNPLSENPCESTPSPGFIMSASLSSPVTNQFSQCSIQEMQKLIDAASCLSGTSSSTVDVAEAGGGSGGGAIQWPSLIFLFTIALHRRLRRNLSGMRSVAI